MAFGRGSPAENRVEQGSGNIYDRLNVARRKRERILATPSPANDDRQTSRSPSHAKVFPNLKPPRPNVPDVAFEKSWSWTVPWLIGALIFAVIFGFAVS